jgi:hypothetical protein
MQPSQPSAGAKRGRAPSSNHFSHHIRSVSAFSATSRTSFSAISRPPAVFSARPESQISQRSESPQGPRVIRRKLSESPNDEIEQDDGQEQLGAFKSISLQSSSSPTFPLPPVQGQQPQQAFLVPTMQQVSPQGQKQSLYRPTGQPRQPSASGISEGHSVPCTSTVAPPRRISSPHPKKLSGPYFGEAQTGQLPPSYRRKRSASAPVAIPSSFSTQQRASRVEPSSLSLADVSAIDSQGIGMEGDLATEDLRLFDESEEEDLDQFSGDEKQGEEEEDDTFKTPKAEKLSGTQKPAEAEGLRIASPIEHERNAEAMEPQTGTGSSSMLTAQPLSPRTPMPSYGSTEDVEKREVPPVAAPAASETTVSQHPPAPSSYRNAFFLRSATAPQQSQEAGTTTAPRHHHHHHHGHHAPQRERRRVRFHPSSKRHDSVNPINAAFDRICWDLCGGRLSFGPFVTLPFPDAPPLLDIFTCFTPAVTTGEGSEGKQEEEEAAALKAKQKAGDAASGSSSSSCLSATSAASSAASSADSSSTSGLWGWHWESPQVGAPNASGTGGGGPAGIAVRAPGGGKADQENATATSSSAPVLLQSLGQESPTSATSASPSSSFFRLCTAENDSHHHHGALKHESRVWPLSAAELASVFGRLSSLVHSVGVLSSYSAELASLTSLMKGLEDHGYNCDINGEGSGEISEQVDINAWLSESSDVRGLIKPSCKALPSLAHVNLPLGSDEAVSWCPGDMCLLIAAVAAREEIEKPAALHDDVEDEEPERGEVKATKGSIDVYIEPQGETGEASKIEEAANFSSSALPPPPGLTCIRQPLSAAAFVSSPSVTPTAGSASSSTSTAVHLHQPHPFVSPCSKAAFMGPLLNHVYNSERYASSDPLRLRGMLILAEALEYRLKLAVVRRVAREVAAAIRSLQSVLDGVGFDSFMVTAAGNAMADVQRGLKEAFIDSSAGSGSIFAVPMVGANRDKVRTWLDTAYSSGGLESFTAALEAFGRHEEEEDASHSGHGHHHHHPGGSARPGRRRQQTPPGKALPIGEAEKEDEDDDGYKSDTEGEEMNAASPASSLSSTAISPSSLRPCIKSVCASPIASPLATTASGTAAAEEQMVVPSPHTPAAVPESPFVFGRSPHGGLGAASVVLSRVNIDDLHDNASNEDQEHEEGHNGLDEADLEAMVEEDQQMLLQAEQDRLRYERGKSLEGGADDEDDDRPGFDTTAYYQSGQEGSGAADEQGKMELEEILGIAAFSSSYSSYSSSGGGIAAAAVTTTTVTATSATTPPSVPPGAMTTQQFSRVLDLLASDTAAEDAAANFRNKRLAVATPILPGGGGTSAKLSPNHLLMVRQLVLLLRHAMRACGQSIYGQAEGSEGRQGLPVVLRLMHNDK